MQLLYNVLLVIGIIIAIAYSFLVFVTGKGDAMGGSSGVRTTFKGKANFDDFMSRLTLYLGIGFMAVMLAVDVLSNSLVRH